MAKLPFVKFFPRDWMGDEKLRLCSVAARGLWIDMLCLMHSAHRRGYLQTATGSPLPLEQIARVAGCTTDEATRLLSELKDAGVYDCSGDGTIYSRRMVRENDISQARSANGHKGATKTNEFCRGKTSANGPANGSAKDRPSEAQRLRSSEDKNPTGGATAEPPPSAGEPVAVKVRKEPSTAHHEAIRIFCDAWMARYGEKYPFDGGKDAALVKKMLAHCGGDVTKFASAVGRYFAAEDDILVQAKHPVPLLKSGFGRYLVGDSATAASSLDPLARAKQRLMQPAALQPTGAAHGAN